MLNSVDRGCDSCMGGSIILDHGDCRKHVFVTYDECTAAASWRLLLDSYPALELAEMAFFLEPPRGSSGEPEPPRAEARPRAGGIVWQKIIAEPPPARAGSRRLQLGRAAYFSSHLETARASPSRLELAGGEARTRAGGTFCSIFSRATSRQLGRARAASS
jgi:hypothetical protein